jgi:hypothetical protein
MHARLFSRGVLLSEVFLKKAGQFFPLAQVRVTVFNILQQAISTWQYDPTA